VAVVNFKTSARLLSVSFRNGISGTKETFLCPADDKKFGLQVAGTLSVVFTPTAVNEKVVETKRKGNKFMASGFEQSSHYSNEKETSRHKKGVSFVLSTSEVLRNPHKIDKSKAHAVWREHFAH